MWCGSCALKSIAHRLQTICVVALAVTALASWHGASAYTLKTLYNFCQDYNCADGTRPFSTLAMDGSGKLFGTTFFGGAAYKGTIFELAKKHADDWRYRVLYSFCSLKRCADGKLPRASVIVDVNGSLYGTTTDGGTDGVTLRSQGVAFKLTRKNEVRVLNDFCSRRNCHDGRDPFSPLTYQGAASGVLYDGVSPLFGVTSGRVHDRLGGVLFSIDPLKRKHALTVIYTFCLQDGCPDGQGTTGGLYMDGAGNFYGTASGGGANGGGTIYKVTPAGVETTLYNFCSQPNCADGMAPVAGVIIDAAGNIFGTAPYGGALSAGVIFKLAPDGTYTVLHDFCSDQTCSDGSFPQAGLTMDSSGNLFGTASEGGINGGTVFEWNGTYQVLHSFIEDDFVREGTFPFGGIILDASGNIFGTTLEGGDTPYSAGTVYELMP